MRTASVLCLLLISACGGQSTGASPGLAQPDLWAVQPIGIVAEVKPHPDDPDPVGKGQLRAVTQAVDYADRYLEGVMGGDGWKVPTNVYVWREPPSYAETNIGETWSDQDRMTCTIFLYYETLEVPLLEQEAVRTAVLHEIGHCLGLVVNAGEVAEPCVKTCHCRFMECTMTRLWVSEHLLDHIVGWLRNIIDGEPTYCNRCEDYLRRRVLEGGEA